MALRTSVRTAASRRGTNSPVQHAADAVGAGGAAGPRGTRSKTAAYVQTEALQLYARHCKGAERSQRCAETRRAIEDAAHALAHPGTTPGAMRHYHARHGCTRCTPEAVAACAEFPRIVEIGAGRGHWARALRDAGVAVEAFDDGSALPGRGAAVFPVKRGDGLAAVRGSPDAALLLVFPPPTPMALDALDAFAGRVVLYAGEPRGGANGTDAYFDALGRAVLRRGDGRAGSVSGRGRGRAFGLNACCGGGGGGCGFGVPSFVCAEGVLD